jgi:hypothetical protein
MFKLIFRVYSKNFKLHGPQLILGIWVIYSILLYLYLNKKNKTFKLLNELANRTYIRVIDFFFSSFKEFDANDGHLN